MNGLTWWFAALTVAGIVAFSWELSLALATLKWPTVEGRVLRSFAKDTGGESPSWEVVIEYEYVVGGLPYRSLGAGGGRKAAARRFGFGLVRSGEAFAGRFAAGGPRGPDDRSDHHLRGGPGNGARVSRNEVRGRPSLPYLPSKPPASVAPAGTLRGSGFTVTGCV